MTDTIKSVLALDIGGTSVKATVLDMEGKQLVDYQKLPTPNPATPEAILETIKKLVAAFPEYDRISVGFPGYVKNNIVYTAPNLAADSWKEISFAKTLTDTFGKPAQVINDADMQGLGIVSGKGLEMMVTLGTGFGTAFLLDGKLLPHLELAHHPITKSKTYDQYIGDKAYLKDGDTKWNEKIQRVLGVLKTVLNYDRLYIGGGNAKKINFPLEDNIKIVTNKEAIDGGVKLWKTTGE